jgi:hypothetical protein
MTGNGVNNWDGSSKVNSQLRDGLEVRRVRPENESQGLPPHPEQCRHRRGPTDRGGHFRARVHCLDARTGTPHWVHDTDAAIQGSPLIVDGKVYVGNDEGTLSIFELKANKKLINAIVMGGWIRSSPVYVNGVLFIAASSMLYAIAGRESESGR